jgi:hypothetical protein
MVNGEASLGRTKATRPEPGPTREIFFSETLTRPAPAPATETVAGGSGNSAELGLGGAIGCGGGHRRGWVVPEGRSTARGIGAWS